MSSGTNPERLSQNNQLLITNNTELENLKTIINALPQSLDTSDATAAPEDILLDKTAYVNGEKITGTKEIVSALQQSYPTIKNYPDREFFVVEANTNDYTLQGKFALSVQYDYFAPYINLTSEKIAVGNTVLGIEGTASGLDTSDANALAEDITINKTAYVKGEKITGTLPLYIDAGNNIFDEFSVSIGEDNGLVNIDTFVLESAKLQTGDLFVVQLEPEKFAAAIGLLPGILVEGNTVLGVQGTATELDVTKTEIYDTTNNNIVVGLDDLVLYKDQGVVGFRVNIPSSITQKEQILISGTGYIELQSLVLGTGCLCVRLNSIEELETYIASDGEYVVIIDESDKYLGTYCYKTGTWSEVISPTAYDNTLTEAEYDDAVNTTETILGEEDK